MPDIKSFSTAKGAGAYTTGGHGGTVLHVTNLLWNDSPGSFKWALEQDYTRIIVFDVSGIITIPYTGSDLYWSAKGNVTIVGQTAPEGGITIYGSQLGWDEQDNVIIRYIKFRKPGEASFWDWCLNLRATSNVIVDHCSFAYSEEYALGAGTHTTFTDKVTFQNNLFSECKDAILMGSSANTNVPLGSYSVLNNVYVNTGWRTPAKIGGACTVDMINNAIHNWWAKAINNDGTDWKLNLIGNYFQTGAQTQNQHSAWGNHTLFRMTTNTTMSPEVWDEDTIFTLYDENPGYELDPTPVGYPADISLAWQPMPHSVEFPIKPEWFRTSRLPIIGSGTDAEPTILPSSQVLSTVLPVVGANKYLNADGSVGIYRDPIDTTAIYNFENEVSYSYSTNWSTAATGLPTMPSSTRPFNYYVSNAHIPEAYLDAKQADLTAAGVTKTDAGVENTIMANNRTLMENFVNEVDEGIASESPTIILIGQNIINMTVGDTYTEQGATATDEQDDNIAVVIDASNLDTNTVGSYEIKYTATDVDNNVSESIRIINVTTGGIPTLELINPISIPSSTNFIEYSEDFTSSTWDKFDITVEADNISSDATVTATRLTATNNTAFHNLRLNNYVNNSIINIRAKKGTLDYLQFIDTSGSENSVVTFNLDTGVPVIFSGTQYSNPTMEDIGDGWYKCSVNVNTHLNTHINITNGNNNGNVALTDSDYLYIWGAEQKDVDHDYIYTNGVSVIIPATNYNTVIQGQVYIDDGAIAIDPEQGDISADIIVTGNVDTNTVGTYNLFYDVTDEDENSATQISRQVEVIASNFTIPTITRTDNNIDVYNVGDTFLGVAGTYSDDDGNGNASVNLGNLDMNVAGVYNVTLFHTDTDGNTGSLMIPITVLADTGNIIYDLTEDQKRIAKNIIVLLSKSLQN